MRSTIRKTAVAFAALLLALAGLTAFTEKPAQACGGFFCNSNQPVNQQAERIIFSQNDDGTVTAAVQILYQGPASEFAWLLPVSGSPEVGVSSNAAFQRLQAATAPTYQMNTTVEGTCLSSNNGGIDNGTSFDAGAGRLGRQQRRDRGQPGRRRPLQLHDDLGRPGHFRPGAGGHRLADAK